MKKLIWACLLIAMLAAPALAEDLEGLITTSGWTGDLFVAQVEASPNEVTITFTSGQWVRGAYDPVVVLMGQGALNSGRPVQVYVNGGSVSGFRLK